MANITFNPLSGEFDFVGDSIASDSDIARFKKTRTVDLVVPDDYAYFLHGPIFVGTANLVIQGTGEAVII